MTISNSSQSHPHDHSAQGATTRSRTQWMRKAIFFLVRARCLSAGPRYLVLLADQRGIEPPPALCQRHKSAAIPTEPRGRLVDAQADAHEPSLSLGRPEAVTRLHVVCAACRKPHPVCTTRAIRTVAPAAEEKETDHSDVGVVSEHPNGSYGKIYFDIIQAPIVIFFPLVWPITL